MKNVLISGASGLIGKLYSEALESNGYRVYKLVRNKSVNSHQSIFWDPLDNNSEIKINFTPDIVINLSGENLSSGYWTKRKKQNFYNSRILTTRFLIEQLTKQKCLPKLFITASAVGYYGNDNGNQLHEDSPVGKGFLANLCDHWEKEAYTIQSDFTEVITFRYGVVLSKRSGALPLLAKTIKYFIGTIIGNGEMYFSWVADKDLQNSLIYLIHKELEGSFNICSPIPISNKTLMLAIGNQLSRKVFLRAPKFILKLLLGDFAKETLLVSSNVYPKRLIDCGYSFLYKEIDKALEDIFNSEPIK